MIYIRKDYNREENHSISRCADPDVFDHSMRPSPVFVPLCTCVWRVCSSAASRFWGHSRARHVYDRDATRVRVPRVFSLASCSRVNLISLFDPIPFCTTGLDACHRGGGITERGVESLTSGRILRAYPRWSLKDVAVVLRDRSDATVLGAGGSREQLLHLVSLRRVPHVPDLRA